MENLTSVLGDLSRWQGPRAHGDDSWPSHDALPEPVVVRSRQYRLGLLTASQKQRRAAMQQREQSTIRGHAR